MRVLVFCEFEREFVLASRCQLLVVRSGSKVLEWWRSMSHSEDSRRTTRDTQAAQELPCLNPTRQATATAHSLGVTPCSRKNVSSTRVNNHPDGHRSFPRSESARPRRYHTRRKRSAGATEGLPCISLAFQTVGSTHGRTARPASLQAHSSPRQSARWARTAAWHRLSTARKTRISRDYLAWIHEPVTSARCCLTASSDRAATSRPRTCHAPTTLAPSGAGIVTSLISSARTRSRNSGRADYPHLHPASTTRAINTNAGTADSSGTAL
jgi:hypothetical protein